MNRFFIFSGILMLLLSACGKDDEPKGDNFDNPENPSISGPTGSTEQNTNAGVNNFDDVAVTGEANNITIVSAALTGFINLDQLPTESSSKYEIGICYSTEIDLPESNTKYLTTNSLDDRKFIINVSDLIPDTDYYYQCYLRTTSGGINMTYRGEVLKFSTQDFSNIISLSLIDKSLNGAIFWVGIPDQGRPDNLSIYSWGYAYAPSREDFENEKYTITTLAQNDNYAAVVGSGAQTEYFYAPFTRVKGVTRFGELKSVTLSEDSQSIRQVEINDLNFFYGVFNVSLNTSLMYAKLSCNVVLYNSPDLSLDNYVGTYTDFGQGTSHSVVVGAIQGGTTYYYKPEYTFKGVTISGQPGSFTTPEANPNVVETLPASFHVTDHNIFTDYYKGWLSFNGRLNVEGKIPLLEKLKDFSYGFIYSRDVEEVDNYKGTFVSGPLNYVIDGEYYYQLQFDKVYEGTYYYYRAVLKTGDSYFYGERKAYKIYSL